MFDLLPITKCTLVVFLEHYPGPPRDLRGAVLDDNPTSIRLSWDVPLQNYDAVTHYIVYYGTGGGTNGQTFQEVIHVHS